MRFLCGKMNRLCILLVSILLLINGSAALAEETGIEFILGSDNCGEKIVRATAGEGQLSASADGINGEKIRWDSDVTILAPRMQGKKLATGWREGGYWLIRFSAEGMRNITFSADMFSSGKAPKFFEMYYSADGENFTKADNSEVTLSKSNRTVYDDFPLPRGLDNSKDVYIKLMIASNEAVNGSDITGVKDGSTYINNIIIKGSGEIKPDDDKKDEQTEKAYYKQKEHKLPEAGRETGRYKFSVRLAEQQSISADGGED